jgi:hypothetical protein
MMVFRFIELSISISVVVGVILLPAAGQAPVQTGKTYTADAKRPTNPAPQFPSPVTFTTSRTVLG